MLERASITTRKSGVGLGLRPLHYEHVLSRRPAVPWFEVITENYLGLRGGFGGRPLEKLLAIREHYPISLHGVSMNLGSADPLDMDYLRKLKRLIELVRPVSVSDHLCWTGVGGRNAHDLLPLPYDEATADYLAARIRFVQDFLGRRLLVENVSSYLSYSGSRMTEWGFVAAVAELADCGILLDVNNIFVSAANHDFAPRRYLEGIPAERVEEMHLAGYSCQEGFLLDTHDHPVSEPVWSLYAEAQRRFGAVPTLIEWDERIPEFSRLQAEARRAEEVGRDARRRVAA